LAIYSKIGWVTIGIAVLVLVLSPLVKRWMHVESLSDGDVGDDLSGQAQAGLEAQEAGIHPATRPV